MEPIGDILNALGMEHDPRNGELIASAITLIKVIEPDGQVILRTIASDGLSWIERVGMLRVAEQIEMASFGELEED